MQHGFCTNCGQPLAAGAAFCPSCGTRVEAASAASASAPGAFQSGPPNYNSPASFTPGGSSAPPAAPPQARPPRSRLKTLALWLGGCLAATLVVIALLVGALIYGLTTHHLTFFFIGLIGLVVVLLVIAAVEHIIRGLILRARGGLETLEHDVLGTPGAPARRYRGGARQYRRQPQFSPIRFLITLAILAAALYGGAFLYYSQQFSGQWSGTLNMGSSSQGVLVQQFPISLSLQLSKWPNITEVDFKQTTAQACKGTQSFTLSGTATMLDASNVTMTVTINNTPVTLTGTYQNETMTLSGKNGSANVTLTLQKGSVQAGCG